MRNSDDNKNEDEEMKYEEAGHEENQHHETEPDFDDDEIPAAKDVFHENRKTIIIFAGVFILIALIFVAVAFILGKNEPSGQKTNVNVSNSKEVSNTGEAVSNHETDSSITVSQTDTITEVQTADVDDEQDPQNAVDKVNNNQGAVQNVGDIDKKGSISLGIDVAKYQGKIDWNKVKASGVEFAMIRVGYRTDKTGVIYEDAYAAYNFQKAQEAGIKIGAYFFSTAINEAEAVEEAKWVTDYIAKYSITYPVVYNCEGFTSADSRMYGISNAARTDNTCAFLDYVQSAGYTGMLYASKSELDGSRYWDTQRLSASYKIWVAQYPSNPYPATSNSDYSGSYAMWQYTNKGIVDGIDGYVDMNVAKFSYDSSADAKDKEAGVSIGNAENNPELGVTFIEANEYVTAKEETNLRKTPSTDGEIAATIKYGEVALRVGIGDNGWSKLVYQGQTVYAKTNLLTTGAEPATSAPDNQATFIEVNESVTAKSETNLRSVMSSSDSSSIVVTLKNGEYVTRTGIGDNGWSRLVYNGQTVYAISSYLTN